ncbi:MAG: hypothetical protein QW521_03405 [Desulfurococcaceae archaeon]
MNVQVLLAVAKARRLLGRLNRLSQAEAETVINDVFSEAPPEVRERIKQIVYATLMFRDGAISRDEALNRIAEAIGIDKSFVIDLIALATETLENMFKSSEIS